MDTTILGIRRCVCTIGTKQGRVKITGRSLFWLLIILGGLIWAISIHEFVALVGAAGLLLLMGWIGYGGVRKKGHSVICSVRQQILELVEALGYNEPPKLLDEASLPQLQRTGKRLYAAPTPVYFYRAITTIFLSFSIGMVVVVTFLIPDTGPTAAWRIVMTIVVVMVALLAPWLVIVAHRPIVVVDETGLDITVDTFFRNKAALPVYTAKGFGADCLPWIIDYAIPRELSFAEVKYFKLEKRYFLYYLKAVVPGRKSVLICSRYSKKKLRAIKKELEYLKDGNIS